MNVLGWIAGGICLFGMAVLFGCAFLPVVLERRGPQTGTGES